MRENRKKKGLRQYRIQFSWLCLGFDFQQLYEFKPNVRKIEKKASTGFRFLSCVSALIFNKNKIKNPNVKDVDFQQLYEFKPNERKIEKKASTGFRFLSCVSALIFNKKKFKNPNVKDVEIKRVINCRNQMFFLGLNRVVGKGLSELSTVRRKIVANKSVP